MPVEVVNGNRLRYEVTGAGTPLTLVHGSWVDHHGWDAVAPLLAREFQVVAYDRRGHGDSDAPPGQGSVHDDVADLAALIERFGSGPAHVVGNSFGGAIALRLATQRPDLVRSVTAHEPPLLTLLADDPSAAAVLEENGERVRPIMQLLSEGKHAEGARQFVDEVALGSGHWALLPPPVQQTFIRNAGTFLDEALDPEARVIDLTDLARFTGPALLTEGTKSPPFFGLILDKLAPALARGQRHRIQGAGHTPQTSHPDQYADTLITFASATT
jgi:pimeloyl-ACP methyl ester carboxylesterase